MKTQLKFIVEQSLAERFKRAVLEKHGKLDLSREGEEALRLYLREAKPRKSKAGRDPLLDVIGIASSTSPERPNSLLDKKALYGGS